MPTKKCPNGHLYDTNVYGNNCPFCPSGGRFESEWNACEPTIATQDYNGGGMPADPYGAPGYGNYGAPQAPDLGDGHTVISFPSMGSPAPQQADQQPQAQPQQPRGRKVVGLLVCYDRDPAGEVFKIYEGRNTIGRDPQCDISFPGSSSISGRHLVIAYRQADSRFLGEDQMSSNGTYVNGAFNSDRFELRTNDVISIGDVRLVFLAIPNF